MTGLVIGLFLIAKLTFVIVETVYTIFIPKLRKQAFLNAASSLSIDVLYIGAIFVPWPQSGVLYMAAIILELVRRVILNSPIGDRLLGHHFKKINDTEVLVERPEAFFMVILGEGVFLLISKNPLGKGLTSQAGFSVLILMIYCVLFYDYFTRDQTQHYVHALKRSWWSASL
jgi:hypothetical protein